MKNIEEVVRYIEDEIAKTADAECNQILTQVNEVKAKAEEELYKEVKRDAQLQLNAQLAEIDAQAALEISKCNSETTKQLIAKREAYTENVFTQVNKVLKEFTESNEYASFLTKKAEKVAALCKADGSVFLIRKEDEKYASLLKNAYGYQCEVKVDDSISMGGIIFEAASSHAVYDETLDAALKDQYEWFANHSGLII